MRRTPRSDCALPTLRLGRRAISARDSTIAASVTGEGRQRVSRRRVWYGVGMGRGGIGMVVVVVADDGVVRW